MSHTTILFFVMCVCVIRVVYYNDDTTRMIYIYMYIIYIYIYVTPPFPPAPANHLNPQEPEPHLGLLSDAATRVSDVSAIEQATDESLMDISDVIAAEVGAGAVCASSTPDLDGK